VNERRPCNLVSEHQRARLSIHVGQLLDEMLAAANGSLNGCHRWMALAGGKILGRSGWMKGEFDTIDGDGLA
jgi:hypothetical protein